MTKQCACGQLRTDDDPAYCWACHTFTHPAYVRAEAAPAEVVDPEDGVGRTRERWMAREKYGDD